jgi:hypothetical protein
MRPDFGVLADDRRIDMRKKPAAPLHPLDRIGEEDGRGSPLPLRIRWREMRADIAVRKRAQDRIGDGVGEDVGIRMSF